jgi:hypothetical protein
VNGEGISKKSPRISTEGFIPKICPKVRVRCAASAKSPRCAAAAMNQPGFPG